MIYGCIDADDHDDNLTDDDDSYVLMIDDDNIKVSKSTLSAKWNDYERVKILLRYGYRLKRWKLSTQTDGIPPSLNIIMTLSCLTGHFQNVSILSMTHELFENRLVKANWGG